MSALSGTHPRSKICDTLCVGVCDDKLASWPGRVGIPGATTVSASTGCGVCTLVVDGQPGTTSQSQNCTFHGNVPDVARGACCPVLFEWTVTSKLTQHGTMAEGIHEFTHPLEWF